jgi:predicted transcriptional regulator
MKNLDEIKLILEKVDQREFAYKSGVSYSNIKKIMNGHVNVRYSTILKINNCLESHYANSL